MSGNWDATLKLLYATDEGSFFAIDIVDNGKAFDVIANVEVGPRLMEVADRHDLFVSVRNVSRSATVATQTASEQLTPSSDPLLREIRVPIPAGWAANEGDVLEVVASYKLTAGLHTDYSIATSGQFMVASS
jgi:hypothetical protein